MKAGVQLSCLFVVLCWVVAGGAYEGWRKQDLADNQKKSDWICHFNKDYYNQAADPGRVHLLTCTPKSNSTNSTSSCGSSDGKEWLGYIGAIIAVVFFGSNFVPVKKYETGEGVFFQWVLCIGIWLVGLIVNFIQDSPIFFMPTVVGGAIWTTGNLLVVPIIKMIGLTMGLTVWGVTNMLTGWITGTFILQQQVACPGLSYGGVAIVVVSVLILAFVKSSGNKIEDEKPLHPSEKSALLKEKTSSLVGSIQEKMHGCCPNVFKVESAPTSPSINQDTTVSFSASSPMGGTVEKPELTDDESWLNKLGVWQKRILGFALSLIAGLFFANLFLPVQFLKLCDDPLHSCEDMHYLFGVYSGILFASTFYFVIYAAIKRNKPKVYPRAIIPGLVSGIMWGIAMLGWFLANQHLSLAISFPLVTAGPGFISSAWGIIVYREIRGWRNLSLYFVAFFVSLTGLILNGLSKCKISCHHH